MTQFLTPNQASEFLRGKVIKDATFYRYMDWTVLDTIVTEDGWTIEFSGNADCAFIDDMTRGDEQICIETYPRHYGT